MIQERHARVVRRDGDPLRHPLIFEARRRIAARVFVHHDERARVGAQRGP